MYFLINLQVRCDCNSRRKTLNIALLDEHYWSLTLKNENSQLQVSFV